MVHRRHRHRHRLQPGDLLHAGQAKAAAPDATLFTAQITKGRDYAFSGAVDALQINNVVYDFEPFGVSEATP